MLLRLEGLTVRFGGVEALSGVSLELAAGAALGLMGPNGCGKTTLFNAISGIIRPESGRIVFADLDIAGRPAHDIARRGIARTFQTVRLFERMTVRENVMPVTAAADPHRVERLLEQAKLGPKRDVLAAELSLAEQRRLEIARALARAPSLMLMDEPTAGLSAQETDEMVELIGAAVLPAGALILTEHKSDVIAALCPTAVLLDQGRIAAQGPPADLFAGSAFRSAYLGIVDGRTAPDAER
jgi:ABC-type branched-subunit amino acid transport system ATPase component